MAGVSRGSLTSYLKEFMWRKMNSTKRIDAFNLILNVIREKYRLAEKGEMNRTDFTFIGDHESEPESDTSSIFDTIEEIDWIEDRFLKNLVF